MDLGQLLGPWLGGRAVEGFEAAGTPEVDAYANLWLVMLLPIAAGLAVYLTVGRRKPRR